MSIQRSSRQVPRTLPYALAQTMVNDPKDIALAIKTSPSPVIDSSLNGRDEFINTKATGAGMSEDDMEDMFNELGLELVDETALPDEDDERREWPTSFHASHTTPDELVLSRIVKDG